MREIIFRGKRIDDGEWVYGVPWQSLNGSGKVYMHGAIQIDGRTLMADIAVNPETVGQYTGLTDKNGKRIFEGDVVRHAGEVWTITYITKYARFAGTAPKRIMGIFAFDACEVIGNIHDNPELLKGGDG